MIVKNNAVFFDVSPFALSTESPGLVSGVLPMTFFFLDAFPIDNKI
ncbi:MAG TPA: hypothetical protein VN328_01630 [Thermodesulfovibrionales bacterium]|nr:hypothetical protein [Thermodesulfovibrionales bacterium]